MADQKITALTSLAQADIVSATDVLPIVDVGAPSVTKKATPKAVVGASVNDLAQTWNAGGTTFTAIKMNVTDTASASGSLLLDLQVGGASQFKARKGGTVSVASGNAATPSYGIGDAGLGLYSRASVRLNFAIGGSDSGVEIGPDVFALASTSSINWTSASLPGSGIDLILARDAADTLAQRRGTNAQAFRLYGTYTDASNYERLAFRWDANIAGIGPEVAGSGTARSLVVGPNPSSTPASGTNLYLQADVIRFYTGAAGSNAQRWLINNPGHFVASTDNTYDIGATNATRPRDVHIAGYVAVGDGITAPGAGTGEARIYVDTADGDLKVVFADGTVKTIVVDT